VGGEIKVGTRRNEEWVKKVSPLPLRVYCLKCKIQGTTVSVREREMLKPVRSSTPEQGNQFSVFGLFMHFFKEETLVKKKKKSYSRHVGPIESDFQGKSHVNME